MTTLADMTPEQRSEHMAKIRGRDTRPEMIVRRLLADADVPFLTHVEGLPGTPDVVIADRKIALFVHGCFWHRHGCKRGKTKVKANKEYWARKFKSNVERDTLAQEGLEADGWKVVIVWECETTRLYKLVPRLLKAFAPERKMCEHGPHVAAKDRVLCAHCAAYNVDLQRDGRSERRRPKLPNDKVARRAALGLCRTCGLPAREGKKTCYACATPGRDYAAVRAWTNARHEKGLCRCGSTLAPGHKRCDPCLKKLREEAAARTADRLAKNECVHCGKPVKEGHTLCEKHLRKLRVGNRRRRQRELLQQEHLAT